MQSTIEKGQVLKKFDASDFLNTPEECAAYLQEFLEEDEAFLLGAIGDVLKAQRKMSLASREIGVSREGLYKSLRSNGNPSYHTVAQLLKVLGLKITLSPSSLEEDAKVLHTARDT
ncbi:addiction module antidote protein [Delftia acidovorans]|uniref:addiction module antidote protein n=1 Tax=Delftia acidovorans TaxID=80866 RepID=UPI000BD0CB44|nr:addiction module antidote protein [Delftia acidovorans]SOE37568.1 probable addiction module antidote protein [Delftia acidovorans]